MDATTTTTTITTITSSSSSSSWQQRIYELVTTAALHHDDHDSMNTIMNYGTKEESLSAAAAAADDNSYDYHYDNASNHHNNCLATAVDNGSCCATATAAAAGCAQCQGLGQGLQGNQPVLLIAIQWTRILILKVGRMYYVAPICLIVMPILFGLLIGYAIGRWTTTSSNTSTTTSSTVKVPLNRVKANVLFAVYALVAKIWTFVYGVPSTSTTSSPDTDSDTSLLQQQQQHQQNTTSTTPSLLFNNNNADKEEHVRSHLKSSAETERESGVAIALIPKHIAVIMDGNRRYGRQYHPTNPTQGHWDGSKALVEFAKWCIAECVPILTVYAFSTDNWNRPPSEVAALMMIFAEYCDELRVEATERNIRIHVLSTESDRIPSQVKAGMKRMVDETAHCSGGLTLNICLSYGSRGEIVRACRQVATDVQLGRLAVQDVTEEVFQERLLARTDPDVIIRTSGEHRLSNFLLWQLAYAELFFLPKTWPEIQKKDLLDVIRAFAGGRNRRFGK